MKNPNDLNDLQVWYLFHSGFAVNYNNKVFIFDYYNNIPTNHIFDMAHGVINPDEIKDCDVYVFVSHSHYDHYNSVIFTWADVVKNIHYIVSSDLRLNRSTKNIHQMLAHENLVIDDIHIETLDSNDLGVAFLVTVDDLTLFHSGDLNWWYGLDALVNESDEKIFKQEYKLLIDRNIDLAFIPVSPKLGEHYSLSLDYFLKNIATDNCLIFPMHFALNLTIFQWLERDGFLQDSRVKKFLHRGLIKLH